MGSRVAKRFQAPLRLLDLEAVTELWIRLRAILLVLCDSAIGLSGVAERGLGHG